jgi:hypothetical protein
MPAIPPTLNDVLDDMQNESPQETEAAWERAGWAALLVGWDTPEEDAAWQHLADLLR